MSIQVKPADQEEDRKHQVEEGSADHRHRTRVAAYCRVSTGLADQETSFEMQVKHYEDDIQSRPDWIFAGIYADEGISGTKIAGRHGLKQLIEDCILRSPADSDAFQSGRYAVCDGLF